MLVAPLLSGEVEGTFTRCTGFGEFCTGSKPMKPAGFLCLPMNKPMGIKFDPNLSPDGVKTRGFTGFGAPLPSRLTHLHRGRSSALAPPSAMPCCCIGIEETREEAGGNCEKNNQKANLWKPPALSSSAAYVAKKLSVGAIWTESDQRCQVLVCSFSICNL